MRKILYLLLFPLLLTACDVGTTEYITYKVNEPIFSETYYFRLEIAIEKEARPIVRPGRIASLNGFLYVAERAEGIHIIDNRNPASPSIVGFVAIPGFNDFVIADGRLYADSYIDLVCFAFRAPGDIYEYDRQLDVLDAFLPETHNSYPIDYKLCNAQGDKLIVGWEVVTRTEELSEHNAYWGKTQDKNDDGQKAPETYEPIPTNSRFAHHGNQLYSIMGNKLTIFDLSLPSPELKKKDMELKKGVTSIEAYEGGLFLGSGSGMLLYSLNDTFLPAFAGEYNSLLACNPLVVHNGIAYATIYSGNPAGQTVNELIAVDVSELANPQLLQRKKLTKPKGLALSNGRLYVCDNRLRIYEIEDNEEPIGELVSRIEIPDCYRVFADGDRLVIVTKNGLLQYDCSQAENPVELAEIK